MCSQELEIVPIARPFFAMCDPRTGIPLSPYHTLTQEEAKKQYQLRVFVNIGENSFRFLRMSKRAYQYYYTQVCFYGSIYRHDLYTVLWVIDLYRTYMCQSRVENEHFN